MLLFPDIPQPLCSGQRWYRIKYSLWVNHLDETNLSTLNETRCLTTKCLPAPTWSWFCKTTDVGQKAPPGWFGTNGRDIDHPLPAPWCCLITWSEANLLKMNVAQQLSDLILVNFWKPTANFCPQGTVHICFRSFNLYIRKMWIHFYGNNFSQKESYISSWIHGYAS